jgi:hypothetical protein
MIKEFEKSLVKLGYACSNISTVPYNRISKKLKRLNMSGYQV